MFYFEDQCHVLWLLKTNVQNVWTAIIREVVPANKTGMMCPGILFGVSYLYSKVELVNAFRINSSLKWNKLYSNRVSNIISECSE
jgi:hypothetical protein